MIFCTKISWCEGIVEIFRELVVKNVGFDCIIVDQTGVRCTECWNGGCLPSEHFNKSPEGLWVRGLNLLKLCLSEFSYNSVSVEFVFQEFGLATSRLIGFGKEFLILALQMQGLILRPE